MKLNLTKILFLMAMIVGVMVSLSSNSWLLIWMGLELTLMSFIPLISIKSISSSESSMKYFIIQSMSSMMFMFSLMLTMMMINMKNLMLISMMIKIAIPPFHSWMLSMIEGLNLKYLIIMFTLMKIAPLMIMKKINLNLNLISILSLLVGSISGLNQSSIRKILAYSSIFNMGFLIYSLNSYSILFLYMMNYSFIMIMMIFIENEKIYFINQIMFLNMKIKSKLILWMNFLSLGGFPPMTGFIMKMMIFEEVLKNKEMMMYFIMMSSSLITMYFYMNMSINLMMMFNLTMKWKLKKMMNMPSLILILSLIIFSFSMSLKF